MCSMSNLQKIYVRNLIKASKTIQTQIDALATNISLDDLKSIAQHPHLAQIRKDITYYVQAVEEIFEQQGGTAANLSVRSRRAYQWLQYLTREENILQHIRTVHCLYQLNAKHATASPKKKLTTQIHLYHMSALYKVREKGRVLEITAHEAFIAAPQEALGALVNIAHQKNKDTANTIIKNFANSEDMSAIQQEMEYIGIPQGANAQGEHYNLEKVFNRINKEYFNDEMPQPRLTWNQQRTYRKFGHYQYSTDTLLVSRSLDFPNTPSFVLDFVVYHELLHKKLGYNTINGRRYAHTSVFRKEEQKFKKYQEAKDYIKKLSQNLS